MAKPSVICYADPDKPRTGFILQQFAIGCKGAVVYDGKYRGGPSAFFGVRPNIKSAFLEATKPDNPYPWYYIDNGYFGGLFKGAEYYRVTKNRFQYHGKIDPDYARLEEQNIRVQEWQDGGNFILFCPPGEHWMRNVLSLDAAEWRNKMLTKLEDSTDMQIIERLKPKNIHEYRVQPPEIALRGCHAVVTFTSNIALQALCRGVPVFCSPLSAAEPLARSFISEFSVPALANPYRPSTRDRKRWMATLANRQWTLAEFTSGKTWRDMNC